ncbi:MAG: glycosyltransferase family 2 protein [Culicoidibacterales bacterium]
MILTIMEIALIIVNMALFCFTAYLVMLILLGIKTKKRQYTLVDPQKRFVVLVAAHNEEAVIAGIVDNLVAKMNYPRELYDVYVIADNCTDRTAEISQTHGAQVIEHFSQPGEPKGKPYGIRYALAQLGTQLEQYDLVAFFDADNLVDPQFFLEMNAQFMSDNTIKVSQSYLDSKNPDDNYISLAYAGVYYQTNRYFQAAKTQLGLSASLGGTGFVVDRPTLQEIGWTADSLTEDLEFQIQCQLKGYKVAWNHFTFIFDEKPTGARQSIVQRLRWTRGHWMIKKRYFNQLLRQFFQQKTPDGKRNWSLLDSALYLIFPVVGIVSFSVFILNFFVFDIRLFPLFLMLVGGFIFSVFTLAHALRQDTKQRPKSNVIKMLLATYWYTFTYIFICFAGILTYKKTEWVRTEHKSATSIDHLIS